MLFWQMTLFMLGLVLALLGNPVEASAEPEGEAENSAQLMLFSAPALILSLLITKMLH